MIKKILLLFLLLIFTALSVALFSQYEMLPDSPPTETAAPNEQTAPAKRAWTPPASDFDRKPDQTANAPATAPSGTQDIAQDTDAGAVETDSPADSTDQPETPQPQGQTDDGSSVPVPPGDALSPETASGETQEQSTAPPDYTVRTDERSKAEKAVAHSEQWFMSRTDDAGKAVSFVETELEREKKVENEMRLTRQDVASPNQKVNKLVRSIRKNALDDEEAQSVTPPPPPAATAQTAAPSPAPPQPAAENTLVALRLTSDAQHVFIHVTTQKPVATYSAFQIKEPKRFVLDLMGSYHSSVPLEKVESNAYIKDLRTGLHPDKLRIVADLHPDTDPEATVEQRSPTELLVILQTKH